MSKYHLFNGTDEAALQSDPVLSQFYIPGGGEPGDPPGSWNMSVCFPNTEVWLDNVAQSGFWMIIATDIADTDLVQHPDCKIAFDGDNGLPLGGTFTVNEVIALTFSPVPAGAVLPWQQQPQE